jgi:HD-GYP domain-containing protein (c-di-GMP phosphodiesterase class II)
MDAGFQVVERVRKRVANELGFAEVAVTTSIGLAGWPDDGISHTDIIASADVMLYRAKRSGGNQSIRPSGTSKTHKETSEKEDTDNIIDNNTLGVICALSETVDSKLYYSYNHSRKVADYALALGKLLQMEASELGKLEVCALLHDVGKISIGEEILNNEGELTAEEKELIRAHPDLGSAIAERIPKLAVCADGIRHHHEWYNGTGYPGGLKGEDIPLEARILAVADTFTVLTANTDNSDVMTQETALAELKKRAGKQLDPSLVKQFVSTLKGKRAVKTKK